MRDLLGMRSDFIGQVPVGVGHFAQERHLGQIRPELIVQVARDPGAFLVQRFLLPEGGQLALQLLS